MRDTSLFMCTYAAFDRGIPSIPQREGVTKTVDAFSAMVISLNNATEAAFALPGGHQGPEVGRQAGSKSSPGSVVRRVRCSPLRAM